MSTGAYQRLHNPCLSGSKMNGSICEMTFSLMLSPLLYDHIVMSVKAVKSLIQIIRFGELFLRFLFVIMHNFS